MAIDRRQQSNSAEALALDAEFREVYRKPGSRYLSMGGAFGALTLLAYYLIDALGGGAQWLGGAQTIRIGLAASFLLLAAASWVQTIIATRYYPIVLSLASWRLDRLLHLLRTTY